MKWFSPARAAAGFSLLAPNLFSSTVSAIDLDPTQPDAVKDAAKKVATELVSQYATINGNQVSILSGIPGLLTYPPYYWWEAGAMFGTLIDYWYYTNDSQYNDIVRDGMIHQIGEHQNLMPSNQSKDEGNDDQVFWAFTFMSAAEYNFEAPPDGTPGWLALVQSVFNQFVSRWNTEYCDGGLRWQIYQWLPGYNYKNTASNGGMFHLGARLAMYTGNDTYAKKAEEVYDWMKGKPLLTDQYQVNDGTDIKNGCKDADQTQWTYNYGIMIAGCAYMYNYTNGSQVWADRVQGYLNQTAKFFPEDKQSAMVEACEWSKVGCNVDQVSFKTYLARWLAITAQIAPFTHDQILPRLQHSAQLAAKTCTGPSKTGAGNYMCGNKWYQDFDGQGGVGQQMAALSIIQTNLIDHVKPPYTERTGGNSKGDPGLGTGGDDELPFYDDVHITTADKAGAGILTIMAVTFTVGGAWWLIM